MQVLLIEPHYLGSIEYFVLINQFQNIRLEINAHYTKQTYKNRTELLSSSGRLPLSVPVKYGNRTPLKEVRIDHKISWVRDHWGAFYSAYGKSPFFEFFSEEFKAVWEKKHAFLLDLNLEMMSLCLQLLQIDRSLSFTNNYQSSIKNDVYDLREEIHPKKPFEERKIYLPFRYTQTFGNNFAPNLSIVDLLMCEGTGAREVLKKSTLQASEHL